MHVEIHIYLLQQGATDSLLLAFFSSKPKEGRNRLPRTPLYTLHTVYLVVVKEDIDFLSSPLAVFLPMPCDAYPGRNNFVEWVGIRELRNSTLPRSIFFAG